jgi:hypothetical protein
MDRKLAADAPKGSRRVRFTDTTEILPGRTGISNLTDYWAAEILITRIDTDTGECELSKPLPKALNKGQEVRLMTLKYPPLYPVGTKEFDETSAGWIRYTLLVCKQAEAAGIEDFDVEIWNELSFGTHYLNINDYYDPPAVEFKTKDRLNEGGPLWELARRTIAAVKERYPKARCMLGVLQHDLLPRPCGETSAGNRRPKLSPLRDGNPHLPAG